jgi:hypothetical protein
LVEENKPAGALVGILSAIDPDIADLHTFFRVPGDGSDDNDKFEIVNGNQLKTRESFDYEANKSFKVRVRATDPRNNQFEKLIAIQVTNVNEAPVFKDFDVQQPGNQKTIEITIGPDRLANPVLHQDNVFWVTATDVDKDALSYTFSSGNTDGLFALNAANGKITLAKELSEATTSSYSLLIHATDPGGLFDVCTIEIKIKAVSVGVLGDSQAVENTEDQMELTFVRYSLTNDLSQPLTVNFSVKWKTDTALGSHNLSLADFDSASAQQLQASSVVIPAGQDRVTIMLRADIAPTNDGREGLESVTLAIVPSEEYALVTRIASPPGDILPDSSLDAHAAAILQVLEDVTLFADGTPTNSDGHLIDVNDVRQGGIGNCYFHAALLHLAESYPQLIEGMIEPVPDTYWSYRVRFYDAMGNKFFETVQFELTRGFDASKLSGDEDDYGRVEVWNVVLEQAYAQHAGGYPALDNGGNPDVVWQLLTGKSGGRIDVSGLTDQQISDKISEYRAAEKLVVIATLANASNLVGNHAYAVNAAATDGRWPLRNPYGPTSNDDGTTSIAIDRLSENIAWIYYLNP